MRRTKNVLTAPCAKPVASTATRARLRFWRSEPRSRRTVSLRQKRKRARVAVDATGLAQGAVSTFFVRRMHHHGQKPLPWRHWLKWVVAVDLDQQFVLSQLARRGPWNDCANLPAVVAAASEQPASGWYWPTRSSTANAIIPTSA